MSNRAQLTTIRQELADIGVRLEAIAHRVPSPAAAACVGKGLSLVRAADFVVAKSLKVGVDAVVEHGGAAR